MTHKCLPDQIIHSKVIVPNYAFVVNRETDLKPKP